MNKIVGYGIVCYPESVPDGWQEKLTVIGVGFSYCLHDKDEGKPHYHVFFQGKLTKKQKLLVGTLLNVNFMGEDIRHGENFMNYLTHNTEASQKAGKHLYPAESVQYSSNWCPEMLKDTEEEVTMIDVLRFIREQGYTNYREAYDAMLDMNVDLKYFQIMNSPGIREYIKDGRIYEQKK